MLNHNDKDLITETVKIYFMSTYQGDAEKIRKTFHPKASITGIIKGEIYDWSLEDFVQRVTAKPTAVEKGEKYNKEIVTIDITNTAAIVKTKVAVGPLLFTDYISLLKIDGKWIIRNKIFTT